MKFANVAAIVEGVPFTPVDRGRQLYDFVIEHGLSDCLELGFAHGAASMYIAAALHEIGHGHLTAVDLLSGLGWQKPSIEDLLKVTGLGQFVTVVRENTSYTWFLKKQLENQTSALGVCNTCYDFCFIDGPKNWTTDGCAFFLVDKLLRERGWILFDDLNWTYAEMAITKGEVSDGISLRAMGHDELSTPHIERVFRLLVMQHGNYGEFRIQDGNWAWAQKVSSPRPHVVFQETEGPYTLFKKLLRRCRHRLVR